MILYYLIMILFYQSIKRCINIPLLYYFYNETRVYHQFMTHPRTHSFHRLRPLSNNSVCEPKRTNSITSFFLSNHIKRVSSSIWHSIKFFQFPFKGWGLYSSGISFPSARSTTIFISVSTISLLFLKRL